MNGKDLIKLLVGNGWKLDRINSSHFILKKDDDTIVVPVHGNKDLPKGTLERLLKDGGIKK
jgi:predicted RNA binding protein YcfA (HicA-like mRNA interferase family)